MEGVLLRNSRDANGGGGALTCRAGADLADSFNGLVGPGPIEKVFQGITDQWIADRNGEKREDDPRFHPVFASAEEVNGEEEKKWSPESAVGQKIEELVEDGMIESTIYPAENS